MADPDIDDKVSAAYRALGSEEPPGALDQAILAAARRRASRWGVPLSIAAVLVLAVGVTLRVQQEKPGVEPVALAPQVMETPRPMAAPRAALEREVAKSGARSSAAEAPRSAPAAADAVPAAPASAPAVAGAAVQNRMRAELAAKPAKAELAPEAWLARIAELRKEGRLREAEDSLAEFKKRFPDYKIPDAPR
jgi:hypothetical protein